MKEYRVCVFCGAAAGTDARFREAATALGAGLGRRGMGLVYGGGGTGIMGAVADAALAAGAGVIGVIPGFLCRPEVAHASLTAPDTLQIVPDMHTRKARLMSLADAFVALPGGTGTLEELTEVLSWRQLGLHQKPVALLDVAGFWAPLRGWLDHAVLSGFVKPEQSHTLQSFEQVEELLDSLQAESSPRG